MGIFSPEDYEFDCIEVWPENHASWTLILQLSTQWRISGMGTPTGVDYNVLFALLDRMNLAPDDWDNLFFDIRVLESAALEQMSKNSTSE